MARVAFVSVALLSIACSDQQVILPISGLPSPAIVLGPEAFYIKGASYGPDWDEVSDYGCGSPLFSWSQDSTRWVYGTADTTWVYSSKYDRAGCVIGTENAGGANYVGGTADIVASLGYSCEMLCLKGTQIIADQSSLGELNHVLTSATLQVCANPFMSGNFRFVQWNIRRDDNSIYQDYNRCFDRDANVAEYEYEAIFKVCLWSGWEGRCTNDITCTDPWNNAVSCEGQQFSLRLDLPGRFGTPTLSRKRQSNFGVRAAQIPASNPTVRAIASRRQLLRIS
jgi:hypothetical protein